MTQFSEILTAVCKKMEIPTPRFTWALGYSGCTDGYNFRHSLESDLPTFATYEEAWKAGMEANPFLADDGGDWFINGAGGYTCERYLMVMDLNRFHQNDDGYWYKD